MQVDCGTYYLVADTFRSSGGVEYPGPYTLNATVTPSGNACGAGPPVYHFSGAPGSACAYPGHESLPFCNPNLGADVCIYSTSPALSFCSHPCAGAGDCTDFPGGCCGTLGSGEHYCFTAALCGTAGDGGVVIDGGLTQQDAGFQSDAAAPDGGWPQSDAAPQRDGPPPDGGWPQDDAAPQRDGPPPDGGWPQDDAGGGGGDGGGCGCRTAAGGEPLGLAALAALVAFAGRRRRRDP